MKKKVSFSTSIIKTIRLIFGIAFFVLFTGGGILLYVTETDLNVFYIKIASTFIAYISLYLLVIIVVSQNIRKQFAPLDKLARGLKDNSIDIIGDNDDIKKFAYQLKADMEKIDYLNNELREAKLNLDDAYINNEKTVNETLGGVEECKKTILNFSRKAKKSKESLLNISNGIDEILSGFNTVKQNQKLLSENADNIRNGIKVNISSHDELKADYGKVCETYGVLAKTLNEAVGLIDSLFSEISVLQNISSQISLYAMNTSLEASRSGIFNMNITNALDELKNLSHKIQEKSDDVALLSIRSKNALNLAIEQSEFCNEENADNLVVLDSSIEKLGKLSDIFYDNLKITDSITEDINQTNFVLNDINDISSNIIKDTDYMLDMIGSLGNQLFEIDKALKNNVF